LSRKKTDEQLRVDEQIGRRIEGLRKARSMSAVDLSRELGIGRSRLYSYESGKSACPAALLAKIAAALDVGVGFLLKR
jgi:transcriptional regulator with XRE-family HTH domain